MMNTNNAPPTQEMVVESQLPPRPPVQYPRPSTKQNSDLKEFIARKTDPFHNKSSA